MALEVVAGVAAGMMGVAAAGAVGVAAALARAGVRKPDYQALEMLSPVVGVAADGSTVAMRNGGAVRVYEMTGLSETRFAAGRVEQLAGVRARMLARAIQEGFTVRLLAQRLPVEVDDHPEFGSAFLDAVHRRWQAQFKRAFTTRRTMAIEARGGGRAAALQDVSAEIADTGHDFKPVVLGWQEVGQWFGDVLDPLYGGAAALPELTAGRTVGSDLAFNQRTGVITITDGVRSMYARVVSISEWGSNDASGVIDGLLHLPHRIEVCWVCRPVVSEGAVLSELELRAKQSQLRRDNALLAAEYSTLADLVQAKRVTLTDTHLFVTCYGATAEECDAAVGEVRGHLQSSGHKPRVETRGAGAVWLSRVPGYPTMIRARTLTTANVGRAWRWDREPAGHERSSWGKGAIRVYPTVGGNAFKLQWHRTAKPQALGHTLVFAPSEAGKTTQLLHLLGGSLRHKDVVGVVYDRNLGMRPFAETVGAVYVNPIDQKQVGFNFLQGPDDPEERQFVHLMLRQLAGLNDDDAHEVASDAVEAIFRTAQHRRSLAAVYESGIRESPLKKALRKWVDPQGFGRLLNAERDTLSFDTSRLVFIDNTQLVRDAEQMAALTTYLSHRLRRYCTGDDERGRPHILMCDEIAPSLKNPVFAENIQVFAREHRKLEGVMVLVFQDPSAPKAAGILETTVNNAANMMFFQNPNGIEAEYALLGISGEEWTFIKEGRIGGQRVRLKRPFLWRQGDLSVVCEGDLGPLGGLLRPYEGGTTPWANLNAAKRDGGNQWLDLFCGESVS